MKKLLIIGHQDHGKDTTAEIFKQLYGFSYRGSSIAASEIFLYDKLKRKYGYKSPEECYVDRVNHRVEWHDEIEAYNTPDKARLAKDILATNDIYVGMRNHKEIAECKKQGLFRLVIGVYDPRKPEEDKRSFPIDLWKESDFVIPNSTTKEDLRERVYRLFSLFAQNLEPVNSEYAD
jgi:hypothetical protein